MTKPLTGKHIALWLIGTFGVVFAVNGLFITKAVGTYPGEDVHNPYLQGIDYNQTLSVRAEQAALGWRAEISALRHTDGTAEITVVLVTQDVAIPTNLTLSGELRHPADAERDRDLQFVRTRPGLFVAHTNSTTTGAWDVRVTAHAEPRTTFEASRRLWLR